MKKYRLLLLISALCLVGCKVKKVKDVARIDSVAHVQRDEVRAVSMVLLDTSRIVTENKTYTEVLNDSGKVVQRIFSYEIKHEKKAVSQEVKAQTNIAEKATVKVRKVAKKKDKTTTSHWGMPYWGAVLVVVGVVWIWIVLKKKVNKFSGSV